MIDQLPHQTRTDNKQAQVKQDRDLERIINGYRTLIAQPNEYMEKTYQTALEQAPEATQEQIQTYTHTLTEQTNATGLYISALINKNNDKELTLTLPTPYDNIGYRHQHPNTTIEGDTGNDTAWYMSDGELTIQGNTGKNTASYMSEGKLTIQGNTGNNTAWNISGGNIIIQGNTGDHTAWNMSNGKLTIQGNTGNVTANDMRGGKLTIQGNTGNNTGDSMSGGTINIHGDPGKDLGRNARSTATINLQTPTRRHHTCKATINTTPK